MDKAKRDVVSVSPSNITGASKSLNMNRIYLTDGKTTDSVLCLQFLTQGRGHDKPANVRRSLEVTLAQLPCLDGDRPVHFTMIDHFL